MKKTLFIIAGIFLVLFGLLAIFTPSETKKTNWIESYQTNGKKPYDLYIFDQELDYLSDGVSYELTHLDELDMTNDEAKNTALIIIGKVNYFPESVREATKKFVAQGGTVFGSIRSEDYLVEEVIPSSESIHKKPIALSVLPHKAHQSIAFKDILSLHQELPKAVKPLGYVHYENKKYVNYVQFQPKNALGSYYIHTDPKVFTNYALLNEPNYFYVKQLLFPLKDKEILVYNPQKNYENISDSPMRYILSQPALRQAWFILLIALGLYLVFKSKRTQRKIPVVEPPKNLTVDFAETIASLYYERGKPHDMIQKKIDHFYYTLRKNWKIDLTDTQSGEWIKFAAQKAQLTEEETKELFNFLHHSYQNKKATHKDLTQVNQSIDYYKTKATLS